MRNDLIIAVLDCSIDDLDLLDEAGADIFDIVSRMREDGQEISLMEITEEIFKKGISRMEEAVKKVREKLEFDNKCGIITQAGYEQLEAIRSHDLNPKIDFMYYLILKILKFQCFSIK